MSDHELPDESVSALLRTASGPATPDELVGADAAVARFVDVVLSDTPAAHRSIRSRWTHRPLDVESEQAQPARRLRAVPVPARAAVIVAAVTLWSSGMAAAATGHLPDPVQRAVSSTAAHVGLSLPDRSHDVIVRADEHDEDGDTTTSTSSNLDDGREHVEPADDDRERPPARQRRPTTRRRATSDDEEHDRGEGPDVRGPAHDGLCNAYLQGLATGHPKDPSVPPWRNLLEAATKDGKSIEQFCGVTTPTTAAEAGTTAATSTPTSTTGHQADDEGDDHGGGNGSGGGNSGSEGKAPSGAGPGPGDNNGRGNGADGGSAHGGHTSSSGNGGDDGGDGGTSSDS